MKKHHKIWLEKHPHRSPEWLQERLDEGFHIHHADGDHENNSPLNLVLVDGIDHYSTFHGYSLEYSQHKVKHFHFRGRKHVDRTAA